QTCALPIVNKNISGFDTISYKKIIISHEEKLVYRPKMINHSLSLKPQQEYALEDQQLTYKYLTELGLFRTVNIQFDNTDEKLGDTLKSLDVNIYLTPQKLASMSVEATGTNSGGNL